MDRPKPATSTAELIATVPGFASDYAEARCGDCARLGMGTPARTWRWWTMKVVDFDGTVLDATFSVDQSQDGLVSVIFESSGGRAGGPNPRNLEYRQGLNVLLRRLQLMGAVISEIRVETERTRIFPIEQQRVAIDGRPYPIDLAAVGDVEGFRKAISQYGRKVGQSAAKAAEPGGSSRRLRIFVTGVPPDQTVLEQQLAGRGAEVDGDAVDALVEIAAGRSRGRGQGFLVFAALRKAIEGYAVDWAIRHYNDQGWYVTDVGLTHSYDLHCKRNEDELHVEVKGTMSGGESVILTRNEVTHAGEAHPDVDLFVVSEVVIDNANPDHPVVSGGIARVYSGWVIDEKRLTPVGFRYATGIGDSRESVWVNVPRAETAPA
jgi:hypothetical protein